MASANSNDKLIIFKGDDTGGTFGRRLAFTIEAGEGVDLSGCHAEWIFDGIVKTFDAPLIPGEVREVFYSHNETRCMALGVRYGTFRIIDAAGKVRTLTNTKPVEVTNDAARCYPGASDASFVVHGIGDMKHSEFADLEEKEGMTLNEVGGMVNTLIRKLKGTISAFASLLAFGAFADGVITPHTDFGDISPTAKISTVISDAGAVMTETDPTVPAWAKEETPPQTMTTNTVDALANSAVVTNALTVATTNRVAVLETATDTISSSVSSLQSSKLDKTNSYTKAETDEMLAGKLDSSYGDGRIALKWDPYGLLCLEGGGGLLVIGRIESSTIDGIVSSAGGGFTAVDGDYSVIDTSTGETRTKANRPVGFDPSNDGNLAALDENGDLEDSGIPKVIKTSYFSSEFLPITLNGEQVDDYKLRDDGISYKYLMIHGINYAAFDRESGICAGGDMGLKFNGLEVEQGVYPRLSDSTIARTSDLTNKADRSMISATDPTFSNAVLAVGLNIDTNSVAVLNEIAKTFGGFPLGAGETATTVGGLLAALAAAIAWLKKNKVGSFASVGGASATVENGVAKLDDFFTESNSLLTGLIASKTSGKADESDLKALAEKVDAANAALEEVA